MPTIRIKGHDISYQPIRDSAHRRATQFANRIIELLGKAGIPADNIDIEEERMPTRKAPASVRWFLGDFHCFYSFARAGAYADNLQVILRLLEAEVAKVLSGAKSQQDFLADFHEEPDVEERRRQAREDLGFTHEHSDLESINVAFKQKSRELHPDMPSGDAEKFKRLNEAHKTLRRELE